MTRCWLPWALLVKGCWHRYSKTLPKSIQYHSLDIFLPCHRLSPVLNWAGRHPPALWLNHSLKVKVRAAQLFPTLCDPVNYILQARILNTFPSPGDLPNPGIEARSPALQADSLPTELSGKPKELLRGSWYRMDMPFHPLLPKHLIPVCLYTMSYPLSPFTLLNSVP